MGGGNNHQSTERSEKKIKKKKSTKEWHDVTEMKLATVRLLHRMQGLEKVRKAFIFGKRGEMLSLLCSLHS